MKIGIDISALAYGTGVSRYTSNLVRALVNYFPNEHISLFGGSLRKLSALKQFRQEMGNKVGSNLYYLPPKVQSVIFNRLQLPIEPFIKDLDVFHAWDWYIPSTTTSALVTTIHDLSALKYPNQTHPEIVSHHRRAAKLIRKHAKVILAVSQSTKQDIVDLLQIDPDKIEVTYEALPVEQQLKPTQDQIKFIKKTHQLDKPYFIIVASQEPRKNINRMIEAFKPFAKTHQLVMVGNKGFDSIANAKYVVQVGYQNSLDLAALYQGSQGLLYCSISEGFGLPILEAFYHQIPVITSNLSAMVEIAGNAAALANPLDFTSITKAVRQAIDQKQDLVVKGTKQLRKYSWEKVATATMQAYKMAYVQK